MQILANHLRLEVQSEGPEFAPPVLLIMGLGMQLTDWPALLLDELRLQGYRSVRFDNRDIGLSEKLDALGKPSIVMESMKLKLGMRPKLPYGIDDMAQDALALLDALNMPRAHVVGVSMGGMIAQRMALREPQRLLSLTSIMSSSSDPKLPPCDADVLKLMMAFPRRGSREQIIDHQMRMYERIGSPGWPYPRSELLNRVTKAYDRGYHKPGVARHTLAVMADAPRSLLLGQIRTPTLVIHGTQDPLLPLAHGEDTARRIPGAQLHAIAGMGHDLSPGVTQHIWPILRDFLHQHTPS
jgi:pimeloyl-ACP methyl ester carboxylesterase